MKPLTMTHERMERIKEIQRTFGDFETLDLLKEIDALRTELAAAEACNAALCEQVKVEQDMRVAAEAKLAEPCEAKESS